MNKSIVSLMLKH